MRRLLSCLRADARFWLLLGLPLLGLLGVIAAVNLGAPKLGPHRIDRSVGHRIVSLAPSITEILFHIGAGDLVVGVTSHCDYPAEVTTRAKVGGYNTPNLELILAAKPDLVLVPQEGANRGVYDKLEELGVAVEAIAVTRLADVPSAVREVGRATHDARCSERAEVFATSLEARMTTIERAVAPLPRPRVLLAIDHEPLIAAGRGTFGDDLLRAAGAENIAAGALSSYPQLGLEGLLAGAPDVVVDAAMAPGPAEERAAAAEAFWSRWPEIPAVRGKRVFVVDPDLVVRPGPRLVDGLEAIARRLHPEAFPAR